MEVIGKEVASHKTLRTPGNPNVIKLLNDYVGPMECYQVYEKGYVDMYSYGEASHGRARIGFEENWAEAKSICSQLASGLQSRYNTATTILIITYNHITQSMVILLFSVSIYAHSAQGSFSTTRRAPRGRCFENACSQTW